MSAPNSGISEAGISLPQSGNALCPYATSAYYQVSRIYFGSVCVSIFFIQKSFEIALRSFANYEGFQAEAALTRISF